MSLLVELFDLFVSRLLDGPAEKSSNKGKRRFRCLKCRHDMTSTTDVACPNCGDPAALDPDRHNSPGKEALADASALLLGVTSGYHDAERGEHARRLRFREAEELNSLVGASGITLTPLRLVGDVEVDGRKLSARSEHLFIDAGTQVNVVGIKGLSLVVEVKG